MGLLRAGRYSSMASRPPPTRHARSSLAEGVGFEPTVPYSGTPLFESGTINHSDTLPPRSIARPCQAPQGRGTGLIPRAAGRYDTPVRHLMGGRWGARREE